MPCLISGQSPSASCLVRERPLKFELGRYLSINTIDRISLSRARLDLSMPIAYLRLAGEEIRFARGMPVKPRGV